jgi:hypothetical protein
MKEDYASGQFGIKPETVLQDTLLTVSSVSNSGIKENTGSLSN